MGTMQDKQAFGHKRGALSKLWHDLMLTTALAATLGCSTRASPKTIPTPENARQDAEQVDTTKPMPPPLPEGAVMVITESMVITAEAPETAMSAREQARRDSINQTLLREAQRNFLRLAALARTDYSSQLDSIETALSRYLVAKDTSVHNRVAVLDPAQFDVGIALGFTPAQTVALMLVSERVPPTREILGLTVGKMGAGHDSRAGFFTYTQDPSAVTNLSGSRPEVCIIVPSSDHAITTDIAGLTRQEQVRFANRHEQWHCLDSKYTLHHIPKAALDSLPKGNLSDHPDHMVLLEVFANGYKKEALADVAAVGDMIRRDGYGLDFLDRVANWRAGNTGDIQHLSTPVLKGFRARIAGMGVEAFRALDDDAAKALYFEVTDQYGMTARSLQANVKIEKADPLERLAWLEKAKTDPEIAKAIDFMGYYLRPAANAPLVGPLSPAEQAIADAVDAWNPYMQLEDKAFALGGKITPATLVKAYGALREELREEMRQNPASALPAAKMTALQDVFSWQVTDTDYVEANDLRGVDVTRAERGLRRFSMAASGRDSTPRHP